MSTREMEETDLRSVDIAIRDALVKIGDGCQVWMAHTEHEFELIAADHRDVRFREIAQARLGSMLSWPDGAWLRHALRAHSVLNPPLFADDSAPELGLNESEPVGDVLIAPVPPLASAIVLSRDWINGRYRDRDRLRLKQIAAALAGRHGPAAEVERDRVAADRDYLELASVGVWAVDGRGVSTYVNRAAAELVGLPASLIEGVPFAEFAGGWNPADRSDAAAETEIPLLRGDGTACWACIRSRAADDAGGVVHTLYDVTERHERGVELRIRLDVERSLAKIADLMIDDPEPSRLAQVVVDAIAEQFGVAAVPLAAISRDATTARVLAISGQGDAELGAWQGAERDVLEPFGTALEADEVVCLTDLNERPALRNTEIIRATDARSCLFVPIAAGRGSIAILSEKQAGIDRAEREMLERTAELLGRRWERIVPGA